MLSNAELCGMKEAYRAGRQLRRGAGEDEYAFDHYSAEWYALWGEAALKAFTFGFLRAR